MKEIVVISGKGGTGKTSLTAAFATLAHQPVVADCDVDAADLHLVLAPAVREQHPFQGGKVAAIQPDRCRPCGLCAELCRFDAIQPPEPAGAAAGATGSEASYRIDPFACEGCGVCAHFCPQEAITLTESVDGHWFRSETRVGPMLHAQLGVAAENSGKLVTLIRKEARREATARGASVILVDGPPGIGCPVIASLSGATAAVMVAEPTVSGLHDLQRLTELTAQFKVPTAMVINKADLNPEQTEALAAFAATAGITVLGQIPYDPAFAAAQIAGGSVVEHGPAPIAQAVQTIWQALNQWLERIDG